MLFHASPYQVWGFGNSPYQVWRGMYQSIPKHKISYPSFTIGEPVCTGTYHRWTSGGQDSRWASCPSKRPAKLERSVRLLSQAHKSSSPPDHQYPRHTGLQSGSSEYAVPRALAREPSVSHLAIRVSTESSRDPAYPPPLVLSTVLRHRPQAVSNTSRARARPAS